MLVPNVTCATERHSRPAPYTYSPTAEAVQSFSTWVEPEPTLDLVRDWDVRSPMTVRRVEFLDRPGFGIDKPSHRDAHRVQSGG